MANTVRENFWSMRPGEKYYHCDVTITALDKYEIQRFVDVVHHIQEIMGVMVRGTEIKTEIKEEEGQS